MRRTCLGVLTAAAALVAADGARAADFFLLQADDVQVMFGDRDTVHPTAQGTMRLWTYAIRRGFAYRGRDVGYIGVDVEVDCGARLTRTLAAQFRDRSDGLISGSDRPDEWLPTEPGTTREFVVDFACQPSAIAGRFPHLDGHNAAQVAEAIHNAPWPGGATRPALTPPPP